MRHTERLILLALAASVAFFLYDIIRDVHAGDEPAWHLVIEGFIFAVASIVLVQQLVRHRRLRGDYARERERTARLSGELVEVIESHFRRWELTDAEREVALLLIKGLSMQQIGEIRNVRAKTVRQQAATVYQKSGCGSRHELAAYFIEDLLGPSAGGGPAADRSANR